MANETVSITQSVNTVSITDLNAGVDSFGQLSDTLVSSIADKELLQYDASSTKWLNRTLLEAGVASLSGATFTGSITHQGLGGLTSGTQIDQVYNSVVAMQVTTSYQDTNITQSSALPTGTFAMLLHVNDVAGGGSAESYYSATVSIYGGTTSSDDFSSEIPLHRSGGSDNGKHIFLRTRSEADTNNVRIEMKANFNATQSSNYTFKFRRLI